MRSLKVVFSLYVKGLVVSRTQVERKNQWLAAGSDPVSVILVGTFGSPLQYTLPTVLTWRYLVDLVYIFPRSWAYFDI